MPSAELTAWGSVLFGTAFALLALCLLATAVVAAARATWKEWEK